MELSKELQEIALMSLVNERKKSFCADSVLLAHELDHLSEIAEDKGGTVAATDGSINSGETDAAFKSVTTKLRSDETSESSSIPLQIDIVINADDDESSDDNNGDDLSDGGSSSEQLSLSPGILSPISKSSLAASVSEETNNSSTWPRHRYNRKNSTVRFTEDPAMVRQKETRSRLAAASSSDWIDMTGCSITDSGFGDDDVSPFKTTEASGSGEEDLVIPDWRLETPIPVLGDESMSWKERQRKVEDALAWLRTEIRDMKKQDQILMCQFIQLRSDIHQLKCAGLKPKKRHQAGKNKIAGSCSDIIKSPNHHNQIGGSSMTPMSKFQSSMTLASWQDTGYASTESGGGFISEEELLDDDDDEDERTLLEPEYLPEYRTRTMSLLPSATVLSPVHRKMIARTSRKPRNMSFSAGSAENTERGLSDLVE